MASTIHSDLLFKLRSPKIPLATKLELASTAHSHHSQPILNQVIRDYILELFLRAKQSSNGISEESIILDGNWWELLAKVVGDAFGVTTTTTLPIFIYFLSLYPTLAPSAKLLTDFGVSFDKLLSGGIRKATVDAALEGHASVLKASVIILQRGGGDTEQWQSILETWLKSFGTVLDTGKGGKKIPSHTLSILSSLLPLISILSPLSSLGQTLLTTLQVCLFNFDNLRRGIARESYNAGGAAEKLDGESAEGELFNALRLIRETEPTLELDVLNALPSLFSLYRLSLDTHSTALFPLPAKSSFPTASAARSAGEIHALQKRRSLAGGWIRGIAILLHWSTERKIKTSSAMSNSLWKTFEEVERGDLYRDGPNDGWSGILSSIVGGAVERLEDIAESTEKGGEEVKREALLGLLSTAMRLSYSSIESFLPAILSSLASTPSTISTSTSTSAFLSALLIHHSRSLLLPSLLLLLSTALASPTAVINSLLTTHDWSDELSLALKGIVGITVVNCWDNLIAALQDEMLPAEDVIMSDSEVVLTEDDGRSKKRRKTRAPATTPIESTRSKAISARIKFLSLVVRSLPSPIPLTQFTTFLSNFVDSAAAQVVEGNTANGGREVLEVRYRMIERLRLEGLEETNEWILSDSARSMMIQAVATSMDGYTVTELSQTLLQSIQSKASAAGTEDILGAILARLPESSDENTARWSGHIQGMITLEIGTALWELVARRWFTLFELSASESQQTRLAQIIASSMSAPAIASTPMSIAFDDITARLLRRADFFECRSIQAHVQSNLLIRVSIPSLSTPTETLSMLASKKLPKSLRSMSPSIVASAIATFDSMTSLLPIEYLNKSLRNDLVDRAIGLDLWISRDEAEASEEERIEQQTCLRRFVAFAKPMGAAINGGSTVLSKLVDSTLTPPASPLTVVTLQLYRHYIESALLIFKSNPSDPTAFIPYIKAFAKPLSSLAKRSKGGETELNCSELAFLNLCEVLVVKFVKQKELPNPLMEAIKSVSASAAKPFAKVLSATNSLLEKDSTSIYRAADVLNAKKSIWQLHEWIADSQTDEDEQVLLYSTFMQSALARLVSALSSNPTELPPCVLNSCLAMLDLLSFRITRLREISDPTKLSTVPFEMFIACHIKFRQTLKSYDGASAALDDNLKRATAAATQREYAVVLNDIGGSIENAVAREVISLESNLEVALTLVRNGPEGSSRLGSSSVSEILRHLTFFLVQHFSQSELASTAPPFFGPTPSNGLEGILVTKSYLLIARFVEGVCSDRPMLLSRQNVSTILSLVSQILLPSPPSSATTACSTPELTSTLFLSLVSIVSHLVRHRKDHITPLFPHLVATIASFLTSLRRSGFGSTSSTSPLSMVGDDVGLGLGKKAEREVKATFAGWIWDGGITALGRNEAKAVGRLLSSLATKTVVSASLSLSSTKGNDNESDKKRDKKDTTTTSLSAPLSKHAPFLFLPYLSACIDPLSPLPSVLRSELLMGWYEIMDVVGKWERESLMRGFLAGVGVGGGAGGEERREAERGVLRGMWRSWENGRYKGL